MATATSASFLYIGFDVRLAKSFNRSGKKIFSQNCVLGRYGTGCGFPIRNLEGQKNARWKYRNLPLPSIHWHAHSPPITHFLLPGSIGLSSPELLVFISGFFCFLFFFFRSQTCARPSRFGEVLISGQFGRSGCYEVTHLLVLDSAKNCCHSPQLPQF